MSKRDAGFIAGLDCCLDVFMAHLQEFLKDHEEIPIYVCMALRRDSGKWGVQADIWDMNSIVPNEGGGEDA